ncbi:hypothetical protein [Haliangium sp.]|uniref:hypothetical protein n=1 Tax=Haliangium sp. TaxID=2663208 RepID=UPI003D132E8D
MAYDSPPLPWLDAGSADEPDPPRDLDQMVGPILETMCRELTVATLVARGRSARRHEARAQLIEHVGSVHMVLDLCRMAGLEVVDGPDPETSPLGPLPLD